MDAEILLRMHLEVAVPLQILAFKENGLPPPKERAELAHTIAEKGDQILYKGRETAKTVSSLVKALALLAFAPGGVGFMGIRFQVVCVGEVGADHSNLGQLGGSEGKYSVG